MRPQLVNSTRPTVEIHPYVQGRLRALPRQEEAAGILLGSSDNGVTRITGFKRAAPNALRQAAAEAGPSLAGFYRLQTPRAPVLQPEEEELWRQTQPNGRSLFLLVKAVNGEAGEAAVWTREDDGPRIMETVSLSSANDRSAPAPPADGPAVLRVRLAQSPVPSRLFLVVMLVLTLGCAAYSFWPEKPSPSLSLDLQSRPGELVASWQESDTPDVDPESASLTVREAGKDQVIDLTRTYTPQGRLVVRPRTRDIVVTLTVRYPGSAPLVRSATYLGFLPKYSPSTSELNSLRKRNRELEEAITALRKHIVE